MDTISSAEFRKRYAKLTDHTEVTVNGHVIGRWTPISAAIDSRSIDAIRPGEPAMQAFNSRPFTPVPKGK